MRRSPWSAFQTSRDRDQEYVGNRRRRCTRSVVVGRCCWRLCLLCNREHRNSPFNRNWSIQICCRSYCLIDGVCEELPGHQLLVDTPHPLCSGRVHRRRTRATTPVWKANEAETLAKM